MSGKWNDDAKKALRPLLHSGAQMRRYPMAVTPMAMLPLPRRRRCCSVVFCLLICFLIWFVFLRAGSRGGDPVTPWIDGNERLRNVTFLARDFSTTYQIQQPRDLMLCHPGDLLVAIHSSPQNVDLRDQIRKSWANMANRPHNVRVLFVIGAQHDTEFEIDLHIESQENADIIRYDAEDTYENLLIKSHAMLTFLRDFCDRASYFMKVDDDVVVDLHRVRHFIDTVISVAKEVENIMYCDMIANARPYRLPFNKWYLSYGSYPAATFPNYCRGSGYLMKANVVSLLLDETSNVPLIHFEDLFFTGLVAQKANVSPIRSAMFCTRSRLCDSSNTPLYAVACEVSRHQISQEFEILQNWQCQSNATSGVSNFSAHISVIVLILTYLGLLFNF